MLCDIYCTRIRQELGLRSPEVRAQKEGSAEGYTRCVREFESAIMSSPSRGDHLTWFKFSALGKIIGGKAKNTLYVFSVLRVLTNLLDIAGVAGVAILASSLGSFTSSSSQPLALTVPLFGTFPLTEVGLVSTALAIALLFVSKSVLSMLLNLKSAVFVAQIECALSDSLAKHYFSPGSPLSGAQRSTSDFQSSVMSSTAGIRGYLNGRILFFAEGSLLVSLLCVFLIVSPAVTAGFCFLMFVILIILNRLIGSRITSSGQEQLAGFSRSLEAVKDLHSIHREALVSGVIEDRLSKFSDGRSKTAMANAIIYSLSNVPRFVIEASLVLSIALFLGGAVLFSDIESQAITIGVFFAGGLRIVASIIPFQGAITAMRTGAATGKLAFESLMEITNQKSDKEGSNLHIKELTGALEFRNVSFSYGMEGERVLTDVSFRVKAKTKVAIVGPSGAGKSTILDLAMGMLVPSDGHVLADNISSRDILLGSTGAFGVVPQRPNLISGSIVENVSLVPDTKADIDRVRRALVRCGLERLTQSPNWHLQEVKPDAGHLSGGEKQRLSVARALYRDPKILFLDEASSGLDAKTEAELTSMIDGLRDEITIVLIAHRLSTVKNADKIIYVEGGTVIAEGNYAQLKSKVPGFAQAIKLSSS